MYKIKRALFRIFNPNLISQIAQIKDRKLTYLDTEALIDLVYAVKRTEELKIPGIIIEMGCALGGSAIAISLAKKKEKRVRVYDIFGLIPAPSQADGVKVQERFEEIIAGKSTGIGDDKYYGYEENLFEKVVANFGAFDLDLTGNNIHLIKGLYQDTLSIREPVALAHIDCDWYESVMVCLERIVPHLSVGGVLVIDDYYAWAGCKRAVDEFFAAKPGYQFIRKSRLHIVKRKTAGN